MLLGLAGCRQARSQNTPSDKLSVVTTTNFYGEVAKAVGGKRVQVKAVIKSPTVDPHDYEPTSKVATQVAQADIVVANGLGYDNWMAKLVKNAPKAKFVQVGEDVMGKQVGVNEHLWYDPTTMPKLAIALAKQYGQAQPKHKAYFQKRAQAYIATLKPIQQELTQLRQRADQLTHCQVLVSEPVFDDALTAMGFKVSNVAFENAIEKGTDPSPQVIKTMQKDLKTHQVAFFVQNKQVTDHLVTAMVDLAKKQNVPVLQVTETMPAHQNYRQWMLSQYRQLNQLLTTK
ncbi:metal ABC transporter solute-binding protein [Lactiplantibacillus sp. WILCCON 0030]|uniref:Metal ABC transporter solute-binding protein n=1 Tax=Lactiplantibacillus brownii TaxID=3069269 RepID=A0ABU1ADC3_9LACO|nr:metal ABC transporter solute-binding protein [Lactiplantibacillus brownii]MDQ7938315.1 metal ABC transporter solute-binding protein [Lactiplantibacillus brownii]